MFLPCRPCCGGNACPDDMTVTLSNLPNENTSGDNYVTSNEGSFHLVKTFDEIVGSGSSQASLCRWEYSDSASSLSGDLVVLKITLEYRVFTNVAGEDLRLTAEMDTGSIQWGDSSFTGDISSHTFTNADVISNYWSPTQPSGMQAAIESHDQASLDECKGYQDCDNWKTTSPSNPLCPPIMTVADATDRPNYCGTPAAVYRQTMPGSTPAHYIDYYVGGTDTLDLSLTSSWVRERYSFGFLVGYDTINWGGGTYSLGWGGYDCINGRATANAAPNSTACGGWVGAGVFGRGWVGVIPNVTVTYDSTVGGGGITTYNCVAVANAGLVTAWSPYFSSSFVYGTRRILLTLRIYFDDGSFADQTHFRSLVNESYGFTSDGTLGEDSYLVGSFPTFTETNVDDFSRTCPITTGSPAAPTFTAGPTFTLEQGI